MLLDNNYIHFYDYYSPTNEQTYLEDYKTCCQSWSPYFTEKVVAMSNQNCIKARDIRTNSFFFHMYLLE